jgi:hypothetical protein
VDFDTVVSIGFRRKIEKEGIGVVVVPSKSSSTSKYLFCRVDMFQVTVGRFSLGESTYACLMFNNCSQPTLSRKAHISQETASPFFHHKPNLIPYR